MRQRRKVVPLPVQRRLRKEAGYGCVKCGHPIYEYHHIIEYSKESHNRSEDMIILCPNCHSEATAGVMSEDEQRKFKEKPYNILNGFSEGQLKIEQKSVEIILCGNKFIDCNKIITVDEETLLSIRLNENNAIEISLVLYDENDCRLLVIENNHWLIGDADIWDFIYKYRYIKMHRKKGDITLELNAQCNPIELRAEFWRKKQQFCINMDGLTINPKTNDIGFTGCSFYRAGIHIDTKTGSMKI